MTVKTALLIRWLAARFVTDTVGRLVSVNTTVRVTLDCMVKLSVRFVVTTGLTQLVESSHWLNPNPFEPVAVVL